MFPKKELQNAALQLNDTFDETVLVSIILTPVIRHRIYLGFKEKQKDQFDQEKEKKSEGEAQMLELHLLHSEEIVKSVAQQHKDRIPLSLLMIIMFSGFGQ